MDGIIGQFLLLLAVLCLSGGRLLQRLEHQFRDAATERSRVVQFAAFGEQGPPSQPRQPADRCGRRASAGPGLILGAGRDRGMVFQSYTSGNSIYD